MAQRLAATHWPCARVLKPFALWKKKGLLAHAAKMGDYFKAELAKSFAGNPGVKEIRGQGLMIGIELTNPCGELVKQCADNGLLLSVTADTVIRLVPPLIITQAEIDEIIAILTPLVKKLLAQ